MQRPNTDVPNLRALLHATENVCRKTTAKECRQLVKSIHAHVGALLADARRRKRLA
jgi:hypothetical protein